MVSLIEPAVPHVPAWKRLGLKLKFAKDTPEDVIVTVDSVPNSKKRGRSESGLVAETTPMKKSKKPVLPSTEKPKMKDTTPPEFAARQEKQQTPQSPATTPSLTKRKSVAFTPETKTEDGDSIKQLYDTWLAEQKAEDLSFTPDHAGQALKLASLSPVPPSNEPATTKAKKPMEEKATTSASPQSNLPPASHTSPSLKYLTLYHTSRATWKFNKTKQTYLLNHLFDTSKLPPSYDIPLASYLAGLQGASARTRIRASASAVIKADDEFPSAEPSNEKEGAKMEDSALRREYYLHALNRYKAQLKGQEIDREDREQDLDPTWRLRLLKRKRAELVLWATGGDKDAGTAEEQAMEGSWGVTANRGDGDAQERARLDGGEPKRRRRKRRTGVPDDDDESSSSSSSESSSGEDSGDEGGGEDGGRRSSGSNSEDSSSGSDSGDESSSSSSSSSESGSDSDSDSDSD